MLERREYCEYEKTVDNECKSSTLLPVENDNGSVQNEPVKGDISGFDQVRIE